MALQNPDIIQLAGFGGIGAVGMPDPQPTTPPTMIDAREAEKKRDQLAIFAFIGGIVTGGFIGSILTMGRRGR